MNTKRVQASHLVSGDTFFHDTEPTKIFKVVVVNFRYGKIKAKLVEPNGLSEKNHWFDRGQMYYRQVIN